MEKERTDEVLRHMQEAADALPPAIEDAIHDAIEHHRMSEEEGKECLEAYIRAFHKIHDE